MMSLSSKRVESHELRLHLLGDLPERVWDLNPKQYDLPAISESLGKFGYGDPILIDDASGQIVAGQGVLASLLMMYASHEPLPERLQQREDGQWLIPCVHFRLKAGEAKPYSLATNRTQELGGYNESLLMDILQEIQASDPLGLLGTGFTDTDLEVLQRKVGGELPATFKQVAAPPANETPPPLPAPLPAQDVHSVPPAQAAAHQVTQAPLATITRTARCPHCGEEFPL